jgi:hypothetical protein
MIYVESALCDFFLFYYLNFFFFKVSVHKFEVFIQNINIYALTVQRSHWTVHSISTIIIIYYMIYINSIHNENVLCEIYNIYFI